MRYLLDTNALAEPLRTVPSAAFMQRLAAHHHEAAIASVTWHEALFGVARLAAGARKAALQRYLHSVIGPSLPIVPYDAAAASWHADLRARRERMGRPLPFADGQIAAIAYVHDLIVVTANMSDFEGIDGVTVENWLE